MFFCVLHPSFCLVLLAVVELSHLINPPHTGNKQTNQPDQTLSLGFLVLLIHLSNLLHLLLDPLNLHTSLQHLRIPLLQLRISLAYLTPRLSQLRIHLIKLLRRHDLEPRMRFDETGIHVLQRLEQLLAGKVGVSDRDEFVGVQHEDDAEEEEEEGYQEGSVFDEGPDGWSFFVVFGIGVFFGR